MVGRIRRIPLGSPSGGAVEQSETERGSRQLRFFKWSGEFVTTISCYHSTHPSKRSRCGPLSQPLRAASSPNGGAKGACTNSPWFFQNGILRTAADPSGAMRRLSFALSSCTPSRTATPAKPFRGGQQEKNCGDSQGIAAAGFLRGCGQTSPRGRGGEWLHLSRSPGSCITERRAAFSDRSNGRGHAPWRAASALTVAVPPRIHTGFPILRPIPGGT